MDNENKPVTPHRIRQLDMVITHLDMLMLFVSVLADRNYIDEDICKMVTIKLKPIVDEIQTMYPPSSVEASKDIQ